MFPHVSHSCDLSCQNFPPLTASSPLSLPLEASRSLMIKGVTSKSILVCVFKEVTRKLQLQMP